MFAEMSSALAREMSERVIAYAASAGKWGLVMGAVADDDDAHDIMSWSVESQIAGHLQKRSHKHVMALRAFAQNAKMENWRRLSCGPQCAQATCRAAGRAPGQW